MKLDKLINRATKYLYKSDSPQLDAELLLAYILQTNRTALLSNNNQSISPIKFMGFFGLIYRRARGEPIAYLTKEKQFFGRKFYVNKHVLIPRPETELLIENALGIIRANNAIKTVADIGTGSGCIAITLALELPLVNMIATDISRQSLRIAQKNSQIHNVYNRINFYQGNLLDPLQNNKIDLVVGNLPYVTQSEYTSNKNLWFEPKSALIPKNEMMNNFYSQILQHPETKTVLLESSPLLIDAWIDLAHKYFPNAYIKKLPDLSGQFRLIMIDRNSLKSV